MDPAQAAALYDFGTHPNSLTQNDVSADPRRRARRNLSLERSERPPPSGPGPQAGPQIVNFPEIAPEMYVSALQKKGRKRHLGHFMRKNTSGTAPWPFQPLRKGCNDTLAISALKKELKRYPGHSSPQKRAETTPWPFSP